MAAGSECEYVSSSSFDDKDSRLDERLGMSLAAGSDTEARDRAFGGEQQKVSLFHRRQLRFSKRLPSSTACDVFEKIDHYDRALVFATYLPRFNAKSTYHSH